MTIDKNSLYFLPLGGSGEIGMNLNLYHSGGKWLMVDCGITFSDYLGVDVITPDINYIEKNKKDLLGLVVTHGHEDHIGAIPYLWRRLGCKIYATPFTATLLRHKLIEAGIIDEVELIEVELCGSIKLGDFDIEFINLTHSIPEPNALAIRTPHGTIVHTGDWKLDPAPLIGQTSDLKRLEEIGNEGVLALVCDSTNVFVEGSTQSEGVVRDYLIESVRREKGKVAIGLFASNLARLESCAIAAKETGRQLVLVGRSLSRMYSVARQNGYLLNVPDFIEARQATGLPSNKVLYVCTGSQGEPRAALTRIANRDHKDVKLNDGDTVIFSSRRIPGNELSIYALQNKFRIRGVKIVVDRGDEIHASGHPARGDLRKMYELTRPKILVPVHGEAMHMYEQAALGKECGIPNTIVPHNGGIICLSGDKPCHVGEVESGRFGLDGLRLVPVSSDHLRQRAKMMNEGIVFITIAVDSYFNVGEPVIDFMGLVQNESEQAILVKLTLKEIAKLLDDINENELARDLVLENICRIAARRAIVDVIGHKPHVVTHVVRL